MESLIQCHDIIKIHRGRGLDGIKKGYRAVDKVSLDIEKGSNFGLVGESGCGKTTLAKAILYLDPPTSGEVIFDGVMLGSLKTRELRAFRRRMQIVFQDPHSSLDPRMTIIDSLSEGLINLGIDRIKREKKINRLLDLVGISPSLGTRFPHEFSTGQRQRIVIARALTMDPEFLILDEPVSNLDVSIQAQVVNLLLDLKKELGLTYLFISHDINLVGYMCDTIAVMYKGRIVEQAPAEKLLKYPQDDYTRMLLSSIPGGGNIDSPCVLAEVNALSDVSASLGLRPDHEEGIK